MLHIVLMSHTNHINNSNIIHLEALDFASQDMKLRGKLQRDFIDFVLRPLWVPLQKSLAGNFPN